MTARIELLRTAGNADPAGPPVHENNVWLVGDDTQLVVIDPAHDAEAVAAAVAGRRVSAVLLTHGHWDHVRAAVDFCRSVGQEPRLHPADAFLWRAEHGGTPFVPLTDGETFEVAGTVLEARHTPGHTPGSTSFVAADLGAVFSGDTLFKGGPGATGRSYSDFDTIIDSLKKNVLVMPPETIVLTGHGDSTTIGAEVACLQEWIDRGH